MSKYIKNIYGEICSYENLYKAYLNARKTKRLREEVLTFTNNLEENLYEIHSELTNHTYKVGQYREFYIHEPKKRLIMALPFRDRVVQWAVYQLLFPIFVKTFIYDSYACIPDKGTHNAMKRLKYWLHQVDRRKEKYYYLKLDVAKYFYRIDHAILLEILNRKIKDKDLLWLLKKFIQCEETFFGLPLDICIEEISERLSDKGMPIGNLTSQLFANLYLNELDQYCKRELRIHYYVRYMDDVIILSDSKTKLHEIRGLIETFLQERLKLNLNKKTAIRPISLGIEFIGYKLWPTHVKLKKASALKMKRRLKQVQELYNDRKIDFEKANSTVQSYFGVLQHCNSFKLKSKVLNSFVLSRK